MELHRIGDPIETYDQLVEALRVAVQLELSVIPPYFTAMYSVKNLNSESARIMREVMMEEMLHLALNCNLLNAIGAKPIFEEPYLPSYPMSLSHYGKQNLIVSLEKLSPEVAKNVFSVIESPSWDANDSREASPPIFTLGQFYQSIIDGFKTVANTKPDLFVKDTSMQYEENTIYSNGGGALKPVTNLEEAIAAIDLNMIQTEGNPKEKFHSNGSDSAVQYTHYASFERIATGEVAVGDVYPVKKDFNPYVDSASIEIHGLWELFNECWSILVRAISETFTHPLNYHTYFTQTMWLMRNVLPDLAVLLMSTPINSAHPEKGNAAPGFTYRSNSLEEGIKRAAMLLDGAIDLKWEATLKNAISVLQYMQSERRTYS